MKWRYSVYNALCLFTTAPWLLGGSRFRPQVGPPMRVYDAEATIYAWNSTIRVVCRHLGSPAL